MPQDKKRAEQLDKFKARVRAMPTEELLKLSAELRGKTQSLAAQLQAISEKLAADKQSRENRRRKPSG